MQHQERGWLDASLPPDRGGGPRWLSAALLSAERDSRNLRRRSDRCVHPARGLGHRQRGYVSGPRKSWTSAIHDEDKGRRPLVTGVGPQIADHRQPKERNQLTQTRNAWWSRFRPTKEGLRALGSSLLCWCQGRVQDEHIALSAALGCASVSLRTATPLRASAGPHRGPAADLCRPSPPPDGATHAYLFFDGASYLSLINAFECPDYLNPLMFFYEPTAEFPILKMLTDSHISVPTTSVASESFFSEGRSTITGERSGLQPRRAARPIVSRIHHQIRLVGSPILFIFYTLTHSLPMALCRERITPEPRCIFQNGTAQGTQVSCSNHTRTTTRARWMTSARPGRSRALSSLWSWIEPMREYSVWPSGVAHGCM